MAPDQVVGNPQLFPQRPGFVLKEAAQGFNQLKAHLFRQPADVVVGLDRLGRIRPGFNHVGVQGPLGQEFGILELRGFFIEDFDKFGPDDLALLFRISNALELAQEAVSGVDLDDVDP